MEKIPFVQKIKIFGKFLWGFCLVFDFFKKITQDWDDSNILHGSLTLLRVTFAHMTANWHEESYQLIIILLLKGRVVPGI